ncbi:MAG: hypothetical protein BWK78_02420 [Thiotrichaceae bacterium IS1]|nr:MAG: hypothetical protein BWK78_02420 [Thiotrichaceae bacterium IS1]
MVTRKPLSLPHIVRTTALLNCRDSGRFRELHELVTLWSKITSSEHELAVLANEIFAFVVKHDLQDEEIEAYISLAKAVATEHRIDIASQRLQIFLLKDEESQWLNYCIVLPEEYEVEHRWQLNSVLTAKIVGTAIPLKLKKNVVIMFK